MEIIVLTPVRILGDGLKSCFSRRSDISICAIVSELASLRESLSNFTPDLILVDVTQGIDLYDTRLIAQEYPELVMVALGLEEKRQEVIHCGKCGFSGYVARDANVDTLCKSLLDIINGRLTCPAEITKELLKALFRADLPSFETAQDYTLTRRESDVLKLIGHGYSNKEIARELVLSVATIKHHVHSILTKMKLVRRAQAMRKVREEPWLVSSSK
ncbi:MAG: response regulator transcription factor [Methyloglobulus sp.]|nr:response regulator transcription factor [Methyloglobulus sp.]